MKRVGYIHMITSRCEWVVILHVGLLSLSLPCFCWLSPRCVDTVFRSTRFVLCLLPQLVTVNRRVRASVVIVVDPEWLGCWSWVVELVLLNCVTGLLIWCCWQHVTWLLILCCWTDVVAPKWLCCWTGVVCPRWFGCWTGVVDPKWSDCGIGMVDWKCFSCWSSIDDSKWLGC